MRLTTIWTMPGCSLAERLRRTKVWAIMKVAHRLPRSLAYWSFVDTGVRHMGNDVVPEVKYMDILQRMEFPVPGAQEPVRAPYRSQTEQAEAGEIKP